MYYYGYGGYGYNNPCYSYQMPNYYGSQGNYGGAIILVLFILLVIVIGSRFLTNN